MDKYRALVYKPTDNTPDLISSEKWSSFLFQLDGRIRELERNLRTAWMHSLLVPVAASLFIFVSLTRWPPGAIVTLLVIPLYIWLAPCTFNPVKRARHINVHIKRWENERARATALDARIESST